jgi:fibronectin-binding autotransporter adhesin
MKPPRHFSCHAHLGAGLALLRRAPRSLRLCLAGFAAFLPAAVLAQIFVPPPPPPPLPVYINYADTEVRNGNNDLGTPENTTIFVVNSGTATERGQLFGAGSFRKAGAGTLVLTANNTYTGGSTAVDGPLQIGNGGTTGSFIGDINVKDSGSLVFGRGDSLSFGGTIFGSGFVTQAGAGTLILTGNSTYTGGTTVAYGTLQIGSGGTTGSVLGNILADARLIFNRSDSLTFDGNIFGSGFVTQAGAGTLILTGNSTYTGGTTVAYGTLQIGSGGTTGSVLGNILANARLIFNRSDDYTYAGVVSGTGGLANNGNILRLSSAQTYTGATAVNAGYLVLPTTVDQGLSAATTVAVAAGAFFDLSNRTLTIAGLTGAGTVYSYGGAAGQLTVNTAANAPSAFAGNLGGNLPGFSLTKSGAGTLNLTGANTYTGATTVNAGTLFVNGSLANTTVSVANGATLGGSGSLAGLTTFSSGGILSPGNSPGTITFSQGLTLNTGSILNFELGTTSDLIRVTGGTLTGPGTVGGVTLNLSDSGGFGSGTYTLINYTSATGTNQFGADSFALGTTIPGYTYNLALSGNTLQLTASAIPEPSTYAALAGACALALAFYRKRRRA